MRKIKVGPWATPIATSVLCCFLIPMVAFCQTNQWTQCPIWSLSDYKIAEDYSTQHHVWIWIRGLNYACLFSYDVFEQIWEDVPPPHLTEPEYSSYQKLFTFSEFPNLLLLSTGDYLFRTTNRGQSWERCFRNPPNLLTKEILYQPEYEGRLLMAVSNLQTLLYISHDLGSSWTPLECYIPNDYLQVLKRIDDSQGTLFAGCHTYIDSTLYRSTDGGIHWISCAQGLPNGFYDCVYDLFRSSIDTMRFWLAAQSGMFKSDDGGWSWVKANSGLADTSFGIAAEDPINPQHLYAIQAPLRSEFYESQDAGEHWTFRTAFLPYITGIWFSSEQVGQIILGGQCGMYWRTGLDSEIVPLDPPVSVFLPTVGRVDRSPDGTLWSMLDFYVMRSTDRGNSWYPSLNNFSRAQRGALCTDPVLSSTVYTNWLRKTTDTGVSWRLVSGFPIYPNSSSYAMAVNPGHPEHLAVTVSDDRWEVYYSDEGGDNLRRITGNLADQPYKDITLLDTDPETILLAMWGISEGGIFATTNNGRSWEHRDQNGRLGTMCNRIKVHPGTGYLYACNGFLWVSPDSGYHWNNCTQSIVTGILDFDFDPRPNGDVFIVAPQQGIYRGDGIGGHWEPILECSMDTIRLSCIMVDPGSPMKVFAGGYAESGLISWTEPDTLGVEPALRSMQPGNHSLAVETFPNPFNQDCLITVTLEGAGFLQSSFRGDVYNLLGQLVKKLVFHQTSPANFRTHWQGTDNNGIPLSSGIYLIQVSNGNQRMARKIVLLR